MTKYIVQMTHTVEESCTVEVDAESREGAEAAAYELEESGALTDWDSGEIVESSRITYIQEATQ